MALIEITKENYEEYAVDSDTPILLDFWAEWCGHCKNLSPVLEEAAAEHPEYNFGKINVDDEPDLAEEFHVMNIPALFVMHKGEMISREVGAIPKEDLIDMFTRGY